MNVSERFDQKSHFEFGKNWKSYLSTLTDEKIQFAQKGLTDLVKAEELRGKSFFDIGCGSGLHSLCALKSGVNSLVSMDFDPDSVQATTSLLGQLAKNQNYRIFEGNILTLPQTEQYDVVYSWGVLHHTGALWDAIKAASAFVKPEGTFVIAIYQKTYLCWLWKILKYQYKNSSPTIRRFMEKTFSVLKQLKLLLQGQNPTKYIADYNKQRGMNWDHDVIDWLGGYPYESATPEEIIKFVEAQGFKFLFGLRLNKKMPIGFFGSGCGEFVFKRLK